MISASRTLNFLEAATAKQLSSLCLKLNLASGQFIEYQVVHDGKKFYAFFYWDAFEPLPIIKEKKDAQIG